MTEMNFAAERVLKLKYRFKNFSHGARALSPALLAAVVLLGCSPAPPPAADAARPFKLGYLTGAQDFVIFVMESEGLLERHRLQPEKVKFLNPPSVHLMIAERQVDIGFGGFTTMETPARRAKT